MEASSSFFTSPRFPHHYPRDEECEWKIRVQPGKYIALEFTDFEMESSCSKDGVCRCEDYVEITDETSKETIK